MVTPMSRCRLDDIDDDDYDDGDVGWRQTEEQLNTVIGSDSGGNLIVGGRRGWCGAADATGVHEGGTNG